MIFDVMTIRASGEGQRLSLDSDEHWARTRADSYAAIASATLRNGVYGRSRDRPASVVPARAARADRLCNLATWKVDQRGQERDLR